MIALYMALSNAIKQKIDDLKREYDSLRKNKESLLDILFEAELPESVYNSNAIENSTLTIAETEKILMEMEVSRDVSVREVFEAKNLARVFEYIKNKVGTKNIDRDLMLLLHQMLIGNIDESIAGRFRNIHEYVRVGTHVAPASEHIEAMIDAMLIEYSSTHNTYFLEKIGRFHLDFETIHPFNDGNGRIGRVLINYQILQIGFPPIIIRDKEKKTYYDSFKKYRESNKKKSAMMEKMLSRHYALYQSRRFSRLPDQSIGAESRRQRSGPRLSARRGYLGYNNHCRDCSSEHAIACFRAYRTCP